MPLPWTMRSAFSPRRWASSRYASTTSFTSRGGTECKSKMSVTGIRMGSGSMIDQKTLGPKNQRPGQPKRTGPILCAPDVKRPENDTDAGSLPSDLLGEASTSLVAFPPIALHQSNGRAIREHPASWRIPNAAPLDGEIRHSFPSDAPSILPLASVPCSRQFLLVRLPRRVEWFGNSAAALWATAKLGG